MMYFPICDLVRFEHSFCAFCWDRSKSSLCTFLYIHLFVFCRSGTEGLLTQHFHCVLLVRDLVSLDTVFVFRRSENSRLVDVNCAWQAGYI